MPDGSLNDFNPDVPTDAARDERSSLKAEVERFGEFYVVFGDAFRGRGVDIAARVTGWSLFAAAGFVVVAAIASKLL